MSAATHGYHGLVPVTPAERLQAEADLALWRAEQPLPYGEPVPVEESEEVEAEPEKPDPVTWIDRWRWSMEIQIDRKDLFRLAMAEVLERQKEVARYVEHRAAIRKGDETC